MVSCRLPGPAVQGGRVDHHILALAGKLNGLCVAQAPLDPGPPIPRVSKIKMSHLRPIP
jgi:hypothetical protein